MTFATNCAFCGGEPMTVGHNHRPECPTAFNRWGSAGTQQPLFQIGAPTVISFDTRVAVEKLRRKLKCLVSEYRMMGALTDEDLEGAERVLEETRSQEQSPHD